MPRKIQVLQLCDPCYAIDEQEVDGTEYVFTAPGIKGARALTVCERHDKEFVQPLLEILADAPPADQPSTPGRTPRKPRGRTPDSFTADGTKWPCQVPDCGAVSVSSGGLKQHVTNIHQIEQVDYMMFVQGRINGEQLLNGGIEPKEIECTEAGCGRMFTSDESGPMVLSALASHRRASHDLTGPVLLAAMANSNPGPTLKCPAEGCDTEYDGRRAAQAMGNHLRRKHPELHKARHAG